MISEKVSTKNRNASLSQKETDLNPYHKVFLY